jgi:zinc transporter 1
MVIAAAVKDRLHAYGIHSTTVQPEFISIEGQEEGVEDSRTCLLKCVSSACEPKTCCPPDLLISGERT